MSALFKQHLIDPELCIRCHTCEDACTIGAITHDDVNVVVDAQKCNGCLDCIAPCPTGSIDNWRVVDQAYTLEEQLGWMELPEQQVFSAVEEQESSISEEEAGDEAIAALLAEAHSGAGGRVRAPESAAKPMVNLYSRKKPAKAVVQGNYRLTAEGEDTDIRHIILDLGGTYFPRLEGQSVGIIPPGVDADGQPHVPRLYSLSSPRDGERPGVNNLSLTVKREEQGLCSNYLCDLQRGEEVQVVGPFGSTFLMPEDPQARLVMICTGTGSAPFRAFTMHRQRTQPQAQDSMLLFFGARSPDSLPYFGPLKKVPDSFLHKHFAFSRMSDQPKAYVQDKLRESADLVANAMSDPHTYLYVCGLKVMEVGVEQALDDIARQHHLEWDTVRARMREEGRYHVETY